MKVYVFEHICGGGMARQDLPPELAAQGAAIFEAVVGDFVDVGVEVLASIDERLSLHLGRARVTPVNAWTDCATVFDRLATQCDAALVIAPEFDRILEKWTARLEATGTCVLGSTCKAVTLCADKLRLAELFGLVGIATPTTVLLDHNGWHAWPAIVKPRFGAGCEDTFFCCSDHDLAILPKRNDWIIQRYIEGTVASVSLIIKPDGITPLLAGWQLIEMEKGGGNPLRYNGGDLPVHEHLAPRALDLAIGAVSQLAGLRGFVGVDMIIADDPNDDVVIEINPRLTMSYVGLRRLCTGNLASAIINDGPKDGLQWHRGAVQFDAAGRVRHAQVL